MALVDYFLKLDGVEGESEDHKHGKEIQIESFSFGAQQSGTMAYGGGGGAGKAHFQDFHFVASVSKASPKLFEKCASGDHIKEALLTCRKAGKDQQEYLKIKFSDILVSSYTSSGAAHGDIVPQEQVTLNYAQISFSYKVQNKDGTLGGETKAGWNIKQNKAAVA